MPRDPSPPHDPWLILHEAAVGWYWMPLTVLLLGAGSIAMLIGSNWIRERLMAEDIALSRVVAEIRTDVAISHVWIEEHVSGDAVDIEEARRKLDRSLALVGEIRSSDRLGRGRYLFRPAGEERLPILMEGLHFRLIEVIRLFEERRRGFEQGRDVGVGSRVDVQYDWTFDRLLEDLHELEGAFGSRLEQAEARSRLLFRIMLLAWLVIVSLAVTGLWSRESRRRVAESALREREAELLQSQKMEAVGRLAGGIAHDINNHLAAITAQCELVKMRAEPGSRVVAKMDGVLATVARSSALIERLLAFSRRQPIRPAVIDVNQVVLGLERLISRLIGEDIRLQTELADALWLVEMDPSQLEQVILNLAVNAREAMPSGGDLKISTSNLSEDGGALLGSGSGSDWVVLAVEDTGVGIPPGVQEKMFDPFFTTKERAGNSGLGLSTVHGILEQNRGRITVETVLGQGTSMTVLLPRTHKRPAAASTGSEDRPSEPGRSGHILVVEDDREVRESAVQLLEGLGYRVAAAADSRQALECWRSERGEFDLLLTDVVLPGPGGKELADRLRREREDLPVLFTSGHTDSVVLNHGIAAGEEAFLSKPFSRESLAREIARLLA